MIGDVCLGWVFGLFVWAWLLVSKTKFSGCDFAVVLCPQVCSGCFWFAHRFVFVFCCWWLLSWPFPWVVRCCGDVFPVVVSCPVMAPAYRYVGGCLSRCVKHNNVFWMANLVVGWFLCVVYLMPLFLPVALRLSVCCACRCFLWSPLMAGFSCPGC